MDPVGVERRAYNFNHRPRGEYIVPGLNYIWSLDGHDKLKAWGIEIYSAIDAFSWYIVTGAVSNAFRHRLGDDLAFDIHLH